MLKDFVALDLETTGLNPYIDKIIEIGAVKYRNGMEVDRFETFVNPSMPISAKIQAITGIDDSMVSNAPVISDIISRLIDFIGDDTLLGHNIPFDYKFIAKAANDAGLTYKCNAIDTYRVSVRCIKSIESRSLEYLCSYFSIDTIHHRAAADAVSSAMVYFRLCELSDSASDIFPLAFVPKKQEKITIKQISFLNALIKKHHINYGKKIEDLTKSEASREIDYILSTYGIKR